MTISVKNKAKTELIKVIVDGKEVKLPKGATILQAAQALGIKIPTLCHDERLRPYGSCRVCLVEVEGAKAPITACSAEVAPDMKITTNSDEIKALRKLSLELLLSNHWADCIAPCVLACPAKTDAQGYIGLTKQGKYREAVKLIKETNPFPAIIGRVCTRPCEDACRQNLVDENVSICYLKRFLGDYELQNGRFVPPMDKKTGKKVAVIGAGPAGLSAAYYLVLKGHDVKIFEAMPKTGGMLRYGMPSYRLPKDLLEDEISILKDLGVEIETGVAVGKDVPFQKIKGDFDAVFLGLGAQGGAKMRVPGEKLEGVLSGIDFLLRVGLGEQENLSGKVVVVGGGNTAIDAARVALRMGAESVKLVYRRSRQEMPAHHAEIEEAEKEGVELELLVNPVAIKGDGKVSAVECTRMELGEPDESGRRRPLPVKGSEFTIKADYVIAAIGQKISLAGFDSVSQTDRGAIGTDKNTLRTSDEGVFAGGDAVTGPKTAIDAIEAGRRAAFAIDGYLKGEQISPWPHQPFSTTKVGITEDDLREEPKIKRQPMPMLGKTKRKGFEEVELGYDEKQSLEEAGRCLQCGCVKVNECDLRKLAIEYDAKQETFLGEMQHYAIDGRHPAVQHDMNKCILCARCVRICDEVTGAEALTLIERGYSARVGTAFDKPLTETTCESCGQCISTCPTASFVENKERFERSYTEPEETTTVCPYCGVGCKITLRVVNGQITGLNHSSREGLNVGNLCVKGRFGYRFIQHPDRLKTPLIKRNGKFKEASWDEALDLIAKKLRAIKKNHGPDAIGVLSSAKSTNEENYLIQKFARAVVGTNNIDHCARLCHASTVAGLAKVFGSGAMTNSIGDIDKADAIIVIGSNTTETHPVLGYKIRKAAREGRTELVVIDPRRIKLAEVSTHHLAQNPGSDIAVINGIAKVILDEGLADKNFIEQRTEGFDQYKKSLNEYSLDKVSKISGIDGALIKQAALTFGRAKKASIVYSMGITQHICGTDNVIAIANLAMLTGNIGKEGSGVNPLRGQNNVQGACDMGALPNVFSGYQSVGDEEVRKKMEKAWGLKLSNNSGLTVTEIIDAAGKGSIKALYIVGENPALSDPDSEHVRESLEKTEFLVVQDIFLSETANIADVVLPACSFAEKEGTFTNTERRIQKLNKVIGPIGKSRPDWEIVADLSSRMGYKMSYSSPAEIMDEVAQVTPIYGGVNHNRLKKDSLQWPCPNADHPGTPILHKENFTRGKGLFQAVKYIRPAEVTDKSYPLILTTGRILEQYHTGTMTRRVKAIEELAGEAFIQVNSKDASKRRIKNGDYVSISSRRGKIDKIRATVTEDIKEGTVFMPFHYAEAAANALANKALDPVAKIPELKVCAVKVVKAASNK